MRELFVTNVGNVPVLIDDYATYDNIHGMWQCDEEIYPLLCTLWDKGYKTRFSCSGHVVGTRHTTNGEEVLDIPNYDCYIAFESNTVYNDISGFKYGYAKVEVHNEWDTIFDIAKRCNIDISENFVKDIDNPVTRARVRNVIFTSGGNSKLVIEYYNRLRDDAKTYILRSMLPSVTRIKLLSDPNVGYLDKYKKLIKCRNDMIKLIEMLPNNVKEEEEVDSTCMI